MIEENVNSYDLPEIRFLLEYGCELYLRNKEEKDTLPISKKDEVDAAWRLSNEIGSLLVAHSILDEEDAEEIKYLEDTMDEIKNFINENFRNTLRAIRMYLKRDVATVSAVNTSNVPTEKKKKTGFDLLCEEV
ncbi:MAG: hypothetical protein IE916_00020 [Epsilonproteobacteria bacterium]|nr:hypothetical protein [Campylobacterota bacterium]